MLGRGTSCVSMNFTSGSDGGLQGSVDLWATLHFSSLGFVYTGPAEYVARRTFARPPRPNVLTGAAGHEVFFRGFLDETIIGMLGPNPTHERFRLSAYYLTDLAFQASVAEPLAWGEFMERYTAMYPRGQPSLPDDLVTAYINNLRAIGAASGSVTTRRALTETTRISANGNPTLCTSVIVPGRGYHVQSLSQVVQIHTTRK
jgi:hypothetical protein